MPQSELRLLLCEAGMLFSSCFFLFPFSFCGPGGTLMEILIVFYGSRLKTFLTLCIPKTMVFQVGNEHLKQ